MAQKNIYVYADWHTLSDTTLMGILKIEQLRGSEIFSFEYDEEWLKTQQVQLLDPELGWYKGHQYLNSDKDIFPNH